MVKEHNKFYDGLLRGLPICLGYLSVSFAFGIFAVEKGLTVMETLFISMTNVTSAGQLAAVPMIVGGGTLIELSIAQFVINLRYALMSVSLTQKFSGSVRWMDRFIIAFVNTDEVFGVASGMEGRLGRNFFYGLIITPYLGWTVGTLLGAVAGNVLPKALISALGIAIYAMFVAIVVPAAKRRRPTVLCVMLAIGLSCLFAFLPCLKEVPSGFTIILCAVIASALFAYISPIDPGEVA